ncbi:acyl carrier protein [Lachnospiraceae bacterium KH1T2]|nr:acyl carrier protein [Lachnospiraceae bacterium KH1T2]
MNAVVGLEDITKKIRDTLNEVVDENISEISDDDLFVEDLGINSISIVQLFLTCEESYGIELTEEMKLAEPISINILAEKVYRKINESA